NADYWIGINDNVIEGVWKFTDDGTNAPYLGWGGTEPQDAGTNGEDCAAFGHLLKYKWIDVPCTSPRRPLCEKKPMKPTAISFQRHDSD
ncbi:echinoidin-like, partial [Ruditapes philippinarum]|uniref:echinoidin-like n=1 Tax=Ruditapes philippinarum TaxID=129788 RepID=UPI00295B62B5